MARPENDPDRETLTRLVGEGQTDAEIAKLYGLTRQAITAKRARASIVSPRAPKEPYSDHRWLLPHPQEEEHTRGTVPAALRFYAKVQEGGTISAEQQRLVDKMLKPLEGGRYVWRYRRSDGWKFINFNPSKDAPGTVVRGQLPIGEIRPELPDA